MVSYLLAQTSLSICTWIVQDPPHRAVNAGTDGYPCQMGSVQSLYRIPTFEAVAKSIKALNHEEHEGHKGKEKLFFVLFVFFVVPFFSEPFATPSLA